jgi:hypothetical protein
MLTKIILILYLITTISFADKQEESTHPSYDLSLSLLQTIDNDAIIFGNGKKSIYVFLDPLCPHSRKFMTLVSKNTKMTSKYQYHIFLYSIPRLKSTNVVSAIYISADPVKTLFQTMVDEKVFYDKGNEITKAKVNRIDKVAKEMNVHKRPYIFIIDDG